MFCKKNKNLYIKVAIANLSSCTRRHGLRKEPAAHVPVCNWWRLCTLSELASALLVQALDVIRYIIGIKSKDIRCRLDSNFGKVKFKSVQTAVVNLVSACTIGRGECLQCSTDRTSTALPRTTTSILYTMAHAAHVHRICKKLLFFPLLIFFPYFKQKMVL